MSEIHVNPAGSWILSDFLLAVDSILSLGSQMRRKWCTCAIKYQTESKRSSTTWRNLNQLYQIPDQKLELSHSIMHPGRHCMLKGAAMAQFWAMILVWLPKWSSFWSPVDVHRVSLCFCWMISDGHCGKREKIRCSKSQRARQGPQPGNHEDQKENR